MRLTNLSTRAHVVSHIVYRVAHWFQCIFEPNKDLPGVDEGVKKEVRPFIVSHGCWRLSYEGYGDSVKHSHTYTTPAIYVTAHQ